MRMYINFIWQRMFYELSPFSNREGLLPFVCLSLCFAQSNNTGSCLWENRCIFLKDIDVCSIFRIVRLVTSNFESLRHKKHLFKDYAPIYKWLKPFLKIVIDFKYNDMPLGMW